MPNIVRSGAQMDMDFIESMEQIDYRDRYGDLDLKPGSDLHKMLISAVTNRARESQQEMQKRHSVWQDIDRTLTAYVPLSESEEKSKSADSRKPMSVVIPISYATMETLLTYFVAAFMEPPIFRYDPREPDDIVKAALLEHHVQRQVQYGKIGLGLHTMWRDSFAYGFGVAAPRWVQEFGYRRVKKERSTFSNLLRRFISMGEEETRVRSVRYEGNVLDNIDPYMCFPDPTVSIHDPQKMEFFGFLERTNYLDLLNRERDDEDYFNVKYLLKGKDWRSRQFTDESARDERHGGGDRSASETRPVDVLWMFIRLVPKSWKIGDAEYPEWWKIGIAGDSIIIYARDTGLDHDMMPLAVNAPEFDGHSATPVSKMEAIYPLQEALDWFVSSHIANVRKAINDMLVVDPFMININDLKDPEPGKIIRTRRAVWGRGVKDAVMQLNVQDVTRNHIADAGFLVDISQRTSGAVDALQGMRRQTSERVTAAEVQGDRMSALSRLERAAKISSMQSMFNLSYMIASHTIQLMSEETWVSTIGRYEEVLMQEFPKGRARVKPSDINIDFDISIYDATSPGGEDVQAMAQMFQVIASQEQLLQQFDLGRIFKHMARAAGFKNVHEFVKSGPAIQPQVMPDDQVQRGVEAGNLVPTSQFGGNGGF